MPAVVRSIVAASALALALAGCAGLPSAKDVLAAATKPAAKGKPAAKTREITIAVTGPADLATGDAIVGTGGVGLFNGGRIVAAGGGNLVAAGAGNLVAAGAGNLVAAGAGNFRLAPTFSVMAASNFRLVKGAGIQLVALDGSPEGKPVAVDANGKAKLKAVPDGKPLTALAAFQVGDKVYRLAVVVPTGKPAGTLMADPINTMVEARVKGILGTDGEAAALTDKKLTRVWTICNEAGVTVKPEDLEAKDEAATRAALDKVWQEAIDSKVTSDEQKKEIKDFMAELKKAIEAKKAADAKKAEEADEAEAEDA